MKSIVTIIREFEKSINITATRSTVAAEYVRQLTPTLNRFPASTTNNKVNDLHIRTTKNFEQKLTSFEVSSLRKNIAGSNSLHVQNAKYFGLSAATSLVNWR